MAKKAVKKAAKAKGARPKMLMTHKQADRFDARLSKLGTALFYNAETAEIGSAKAKSLARKMIATADALYRAANAK